jgi:SAM-dependent methyltransferase
MMRYLLYFFYLEWYWGFRLARFIIRYEISGEKKYGIHTLGLYHLPRALSFEDRKHFSRYEPLNYYTSSRLLNYLKPGDLSTGFLDVGCGKGRLMAMAAAYGFTDITGIDFSKKLCEAAARVCRSIESKYPNTSFDIEYADARYYAISESVGVIFLFNPFDAEVMGEFIKRVFESLERRNRPLKILYANPQCKQLWLDAGFIETDSFVKLRYLQGSVLERE